MLLDTVHAQQYTSEWQFLQAILSIQSADNKLQLWNGVVPLKVSGESGWSLYAALSAKPLQTNITLI